MRECAVGPDCWWGGDMGRGVVLVIATLDSQCPWQRHQYIRHHGISSDSGPFSVDIGPLISHMGFGSSSSKGSGLVFMNELQKDTSAQGARVCLFFKQIWQTLLLPRWLELLTGTDNSQYHWEGIRGGWGSSKIASEGPREMPRSAGIAISRLR